MTLNIALSRRLGTALVLLAVAAGGSAMVATALAGRAALSDERDAKIAFVAKSLPSRRSRAAGTAPSRESLAFEAPSSTLAAARFDALVRSAVVGAGGRVLSSRADVKAGERVGARNERIEIQAAVQGRIEALQAALFRIENGYPLILVDALDMRSASGDDTATREAAPLLTATLTLTAYWSGPPP